MREENLQEMHGESVYPILLPVYVANVTSDMLWSHIPKGESGSTRERPTEAACGSLSPAGSVGLRHGLG